MSYRISTRAVGLTTADVIANLRANVEGGAFDLLLRSAAKDDGAVGLQSASSSQIIFSSAPGGAGYGSGQTLTAGGIVGIVLGVLAAVALVLVGAHYLVNSRRAQQWGALKDFEMSRRGGGGGGGGGVGGGGGGGRGGARGPGSGSVAGRYADDEEEEGGSGGGGGGGGGGYGRDAVDDLDLGLGFDGDDDGGFHDESRRGQGQGNARGAAVVSQLHSGGRFPSLQKASSELPQIDDNDLQQGPSERRLRGGDREIGK